MPSVAILAQDIFRLSSENPVPNALGLWREERREEPSAQEIASEPPPPKHQRKHL
jgi:hypothetical protein